MKRPRLGAQPWLWSAVGCLVLVAVIGAMSPVVSSKVITANLALASFLAIVGIGQAFPVASGGGGIDLSIPYVMNFTAFLAVATISGSAGSVLLAAAGAIGFGALVGAVNGLVVVALRIPPIIGTLAVGFVTLTFVQIQAHNSETRFSDRSFTDLVRGTTLGMPNIVYVALALAGLAAVLIHRTAYGRGLLAVGQSREAAYLSGTPVRRTVLIAYVLSGACAGLGGLLLAGSVGSADLALGNPYLLASVGAVVLGGARIAGGTASIVGTMLGALLLTLLSNAVTVAGLDLEFQNIARGAVITLVLVAASGSELGSVRRRFAVPSRWRRGRGPDGDGTADAGSPSDLLPVDAPPTDVLRASPLGPAAHQ